jgi:hypothetical protein
MINWNRFQRCCASQSKTFNKYEVLLMSINTFDSVSALSMAELDQVNGGGLEQGANAAALRFLGEQALKRVGGAALGLGGILINVFGNPQPLSNGEITPTTPAPIR